MSRGGVPSHLGNVRPLEEEPAEVFVSKGCFIVTNMLVMCTGVFFSEFPSSDMSLVPLDDVVGYIISKSMWVEFARL